MRIPVSVSLAWVIVMLVMVVQAGAAQTPKETQPDVVVAEDGGGDFLTVQEAIDKAPQTTSAEDPWIILVKPGTYKEILYVQREKRFLHLVGEDPEKTIITYHLSAGWRGLDGREIGTFRTPTVTIDADDFTVENITIENSAGRVGQALALRVDGDRIVFRNCRFLGFQDTIFLNRGRQYFADCTIVGAVDFIFGGATAFFEDCTLRLTRDGYITAASTPPDAEFGFVFSNCKIIADQSVEKVYLGRPWRDFASTIFLNTEMPAAIRPEGWHNWSRPEREVTVRYAEFNSTGPGAKPDQRVEWARSLTENEASKITTERVLDGWKPTGKTAGEDSAMRAGRALATVTYDIEYGRAAGKPLLLDASVPADEGRHPIAIIVHGGGWGSGDKQMDITGLFQPLTEAGFAWFSINYRLAPEHRWPAAFEDVRTAIRWVKEHAADFNADPARIALIGYSAGGQLVSLAAAQADDGTRVQAVVGIAPAADLVTDTQRRGQVSKSLQDLLELPESLTDASIERIRAISPATHIKPGMPPFLLVQGSADKTVLPEHTEAFAEKLREAGVEVEIVTLKDVPHRLSEWDNFETSYKKTITGWLGRQMKAE